MKPDPDVSRRRPPPEVPPALQRAGTRWPLRPALFALAIVGAFLSVGAALFFVVTSENAAVEDEIERLLYDAPSEPPELPPYFYDVASRPASVSLTTTPEGALATLNEERLGPTPLALDALRPGYYEFRLRHPDFAPLDTSLYIASGTHYAFALDLVPLPAPEASAPVRGAAPGGRARPPRPARAERREEPAPPSGRFAQADPETVRRVSHTGSLSVASRPAGARVLVDGQARGQTPLTLGSLRPGAYTVTLSLRGYETEERTVQVGAGAVLHVEARLTPSR